MSHDQKNLQDIGRKVLKGAVHTRFFSRQTALMRINRIAGRVALCLMLQAAYDCFVLSALGNIPFLKLEDPGKEFKQYLATMPFIERVEYEQSHRGKYGAGFVKADGAWQPGGYFLRYLTNCPNTTNMIVWGLSPDNEWEYASDWKSVCYGPRKFATNIASAMTEWHAFDLRKLTQLGIPEAKPNSFIWVSQNDFEFQNRWGQFYGKIQSYDANRPLAVEYQPKEKNSPAYWAKGKIQYFYDNNEAFPPSRFIEDLTGKNNEHLITTNIIHRLDIGVSALFKDGYYMTNFIPNGAEIRSVNMISNLVRYDVKPDGTMVKYKYSTSTESFARPARYSIIAFFLVSLSVIGVSHLLRRGKKEQASASPKNNTQ